MRKLILALLFGLLVAACSAPAPPATPATEAATPTPTIPPNPPPTSQPARLTLWLPDWMVLDTPEATDALQGTIDAFTAESGVTVDVIAKPPRGEGGLLDFLAASYPVAPGILPDVIALPFTDAELAADADYLQPLNSLLSSELQDDLFPFAQDIARRGEARLAIPFAANFEHLGFQLSAVSEPPVDWQVVLDSGVTYAFPAGGNEAVLTDALLVHYLSSLGAETNPRNEQALRRTLTFYDEARKRGLIDVSTTRSDNAAATWQRVLQGQVEMAHTASDLWLGDREQATILRFGPIPTADSTPRAIARGWAYAIVTADEERQALSANLIERLMAPEALAEWSVTAERLPTRRAALARWPGGNYTLFAGETLESATRPPDWAADTVLVRSLHRAMIDILNGATDIESAVRTAVESW
ncbi:MAG: extracellular solute-binding protein [Caldilineales bacterium]|nr:extracellular solute-binding protein [Caldilineales bacterium]